MLRGLAWIAAALGAAVLVTALFAYRGAAIQKGLQENIDKANEQIDEKLPELKEKLGKLPELPQVPGATSDPEPRENGDETAEKPAAQKPAEGDPKPSPDPAGKPAGGATAPTTPPKPGEKAEPPKPEYTLKDPPPVAKARHKVAKGETLYSLAETYYEDGSLWKLIAEANKLKDPADLKEGMVVVIPGK
jgi:5'-nucleotidase